jgi:excisionase family DNA binding protein
MQPRPLSMSTTSKRKPNHEPTKPISVTVSDACSISGLGRTLIYELISDGKLKTATIGRRRLVIYASLAALIESSAS